MFTHGYRKTYKGRIYKTKLGTHCERCKIKSCKNYFIKKYTRDYLNVTTQDLTHLKIQVLV